MREVIAADPPGRRMGLSGLTRRQVVTLITFPSLELLSPGSQLAGEVELQAVTTGGPIAAVEFTVVRPCPSDSARSRVGPVTRRAAPVGGCAALKCTLTAVIPRYGDVHARLRSPDSVPVSLSAPVGHAESALAVDPRVSGGGSRNWLRALATRLPIQC